MIMMHQCMFILNKKCTILVSDADKGGGYIYMAEGSRYMGNLYLLYFKPKTAHKIDFFNNRNFIDFTIKMYY